MVRDGRHREDHCSPRSIDIGDMETFNPLNTVTCSQPCEGNKSIIGQTDDIPMPVDESSLRLTIFRAI